MRTNESRQSASLVLGPTQKKKWRAAFQSNFGTGIEAVEQEE